MCLKNHLKPSIEVQKALRDVDNSLQKSTFQKTTIWIKVFFKSLLIPVTLLILDMAFDGLLVHKYYDHEDSEFDEQYNLCINATVLNETATHSNDTFCEAKWSSTMRFVCIPLALDKFSRFNYSLAFIISPWIFYFIEHSLSKYWAESVEVKKYFK